MNHHTSVACWNCYHRLPTQVQRAADAKYGLLRVNPQHPSLHLKRVGKYWSVRINSDYRALGQPVLDGVVWLWIGSHAECAPLFS